MIKDPITVHDLFIDILYLKLFVFYSMEIENN